MLTTHTILAKEGIMAKQGMNKKPSGKMAKEKGTKKASVEELQGKAKQGSTKATSK